MIDTHCHLDIAAFDADRDAVLARAAAAGVRGVLVPAIRPRTWQALREMAARYGEMAAHDGDEARQDEELAASGASAQQGDAAVSHADDRPRYPAVRIALGIHPQIVPELAPDEAPVDFADILARAVADSGAVAVGECGLDSGTGDHARQEALLRAHIRAARAVKKPLVIHVLRAHDAAPRILREERAREVGGVLHSYSGGDQLVGVYRDLGMCFSFAGPITYPNARKPVAAARAVPDALLLAETDAPDQAPAKHRGTRSEPAFVATVIEGLAAARGVSPREIAELTTQNAERLFGSFARAERLFGKHGSA